MRSAISVRHFQPEPVEQAMEIAPPTDPPFSILDEPELCGECKSGSRLANGLPVSSCLLLGALDDEAVMLETGNVQREALAGRKIPGQGIGPSAITRFSDEDRPWRKWG